MEGSSDTVFIIQHLILQKSCWNSSLYLTVLFQLVWGRKWSSDMERILYLQDLLHLRKRATGFTLSCKISAVGREFTVATRILWVWKVHTYDISLQLFWNCVPLVTAEMQNPDYEFRFSLGMLPPPPSNFHFLLAIFLVMCWKCDIQYEMPSFFFFNWNEIGDSRRGLNCFWFTTYSVLLGST